MPSLSSTHCRPFLSSPSRHAPSLRARHVAAKDEFIQLRKAITKELELEVALLGKALKDKVAGGEAEARIGRVKKIGQSYQ